MTDQPITDNDLHAYVDGELDAARRAEVEAHLAANPAAAKIVRDYRRLNLRRRWSWSRRARQGAGR